VLISFYCVTRVVVDTLPNHAKFERARIYELIEDFVGAEGAARNVAVLLLPNNSSLFTVANRRPSISYLHLLLAVFKILMAS
jgi:hypothetical protein